MPSSASRSVVSEVEPTLVADIPCHLPIDGLPRYPRQLQFSRGISVLRKRWSCPMETDNVRGSPSPSGRRWETIPPGRLHRSSRLQHDLLAGRIATFVSGLTDLVPTYHDAALAIPLEHRIPYREVVCATVVRTHKSKVAARHVLLINTWCRYPPPLIVIGFQRKRAIYSLAPSHPHGNSIPLLR